MPYDGFNITGKVILITGGTSGIGRAIALGCASAGAIVVAGSSNPEKVAAIRKELGKDNDAIQLDVSDAASAKSAVEYTARKFGRIDGLVNAAGIIKRVPSIDMLAEDFERVVKVNLIGNFIIAQAVARVMKDQTPDSKGFRGAIVNIASLNSFISLTEVLAYAASKSGVMGLTRGLANEWAPLGIRVNGIIANSSKARRAAPGSSNIRRRIASARPTSSSAPRSTCSAQPQAIPTVKRSSWTAVSWPKVRNPK